MMKLKKQQIAIAKYFERLGGSGTSGDARKAADVTQADYHLQRLRKAKCLKRIARNTYKLAPRWRSRCTP